MNGQKLQNPNPSPAVWAWIVTFITLAILIALKVLCKECIPDEAAGEWAKALQIIDESIGALGTVTLALVAISGTPVLMARVSFAGLLIWIVGFLVLLIRGPGLADLVMAVGSVLIMLAHSKHAVQGAARWYQRLLKPNPIPKVLCALLIICLIGIAMQVTAKFQIIPGPGFRNGPMAMAAKPSNRIA